MIENSDNNHSIIDVTKRDPDLEVFACLAAAESRRRKRQRTEENNDLKNLEKTYFGPEVGYIRRCFNRVMLSQMTLKGDLLDYGCGGSCWKEEYWPHFDSVTAAEIDKSALEEIEIAYPSATLWHTENGVIETQRKFDVILSSSVVGYILPVQADHHIASCAEFLKDDGQLIVTLVLAFNIWAFLGSKRLVDAGDGTSFAYHYRKRELVNLLKRHGFTKFEYFALGGRILGTWKFNQWAYRMFPRFGAIWSY